MCLPNTSNLMNRSVVQLVQLMPACNVERE